MATEPTNQLDTLLTTQISQSFPVTAPLIRLPGGEGRTYRAGDYVYRREARPEEASYVADVFAQLPAIGFRIPRPIRSRQGTWLSSTGWSAWSVVAGRHAIVADIPAVLPALAALHTCLRPHPAPTFLAQKDTPFTRAEQAAWGDLPPDLHPDVVALAQPLLARRNPLPHLPAQLIHLDLNDTNILIAAGLPPAFIDFTPAWRPVAYAGAVFGYWLGAYRGHRSALEACTTIPAFDQLLLRVGLSKVMLVQTLQQPSRGDHPDIAHVATAVQRIVDWIDRPETTGQRS
jgi:Phosphotransferase enzyme family